MTSALPPDLDPTLNVKPLAELQQHCESQITAFQRSRDGRQDSSSCEEILRRAAAGDGDAFALLWAITIPFVRQNCPPQCRDSLDDLQQEVAIRLMKKFRHPIAPYRAGSFAEYRIYVNVTIRSVCSNAQRSPYAAPVSLEARRDIHATPMTQEVLRHVFYNRCEALLPDALHREAFRHRFVRMEEIADIVVALRVRFPDITTKHVYRIIERCMDLLKAHPEVREMLESAGGNE